MSESILALQGALAAFSIVAVGAAWLLAHRAERSAMQSKREAKFAENSADAATTNAKEAVRDVLVGVKEAHNKLVTTQAEQGAAIERLGAEVAGRSLRR